jgi:hypothetical protein
MKKEADVRRGSGSPHVFARRQCVCAGGRFKGSRRCQKSVPSRGWCPLMCDDPLLLLPAPPSINLSAVQAEVGWFRFPGGASVRRRRRTALQMASMIGRLSAAVCACGATIDCYWSARESA